MRILIEQSGYDLVNMGDLAMLQVTIARLNKLWPDVLIEVFTRAPDRLTKFCPNTCPLLPSGQDIWFEPLSQRLLRRMPKRVAQHLPEFEWKLRHCSPSLVISLIHSKLKTRQTETKDFNSFVEAVNAADLVIASGGGYITDTFDRKATKVLGILGLATRLGKPTVMLGQGLGPLQNPKLRTKAKAVIPKINLITLREKRAGVPLLKSLDVSDKRFIVTGDDAIELAYEARNTELGHGIGVNLRIAKYAKVSIDFLETVRSTLQDFARKKDVPLIPVPIEFLQSNSDVRTIQKILAGYDDSSDAGQSLEMPTKVIKQVGRCRVVVAGSYHAAVFALAQGIPVVGLAQSEYYKDKFLGLADQFGVGCEVVFLNDQQLRVKLIASVVKAWESSESVKPQLLESARRQIELGHAAYRQVYELVESH